MSNRIYLNIAIVFLLVITVFPLVSAVDSYKPYLHNPVVPENPGVSVQGSFETVLPYGSGTYQYPIEVPRGTNGLQPSLGLMYNSQLTKNRPSKVGSGWAITENYVGRDVNYTFNDTADDGFILSLNGQQHKLFYDAGDSKYHTQIESFLNIQKKTGGNNTRGDYWIVRGRDGTAYRFGFNNNSEYISGPYNYSTKWSLDLVNDTYDNKIRYTYLENPFTNDSGAVYPDEIIYNNDYF